jgi:hypothetical protein
MRPSLQNSKIGFIKKNPPLRGLILHPNSNKANSKSLAASHHQNNTEADVARAIARVAVDTTRRTQIHAFIVVPRRTAQHPVVACRAAPFTDGRMAVHAPFSAKFKNRFYQKKSPATRSDPASKQ